MKRNVISTSLLALFTAIFASNATAQARVVETAGQAMSLCKAQAEKAHPGYQRSKSTQIKESRGVYKIKLKVNTSAGNVITYCQVAKDGSVTYEK